MKNTIEQIAGDTVITTQTLSGNTDLLIRLNKNGIVFTPMVGQEDEKDCDIEFTWGELFHLIHEGV